MKKPILFLLLTSLFCFPEEATADVKRFEFTADATDAYLKIINLQFEEADIILSQVKTYDANNLIAYLIENYKDLFTVLINENKTAFRLLEKNKDIRLAKIKEGSTASPYYLYCQAEVLLHWALMRLKFDEHYEAYHEIKKAYKLLTKNQEKFPHFLANKKSLGVLHALIGTIPGNYKWAIKLLSGMNGSIEQGRREIEEVMEYARYNEFIFKEETTVMYAFLMLHLNNQEQEAWNVIHNAHLNPKESPLACFVMANVALRTGRTDQAIKILQDRPKGCGYHDFHYLDYMLGLAKLYRQDKNADQYFLKYIQRFKGQNYIKEAYQKVAWHHLLNNNIQGYYTYITKCKKEGNALIGGDKNAQKEANSEIIPDETLLKARLLFDGGFYEKAYSTLMQKPYLSYAKERNKLEYTYRLGRILHRQSDYTKAVKYYKQTIAFGKHATSYLACNAALQIGLIYESKQQIEEARQYYQLCLEIHPAEYKNGLHQKAKAGLNRIRRS